MKIFKVLLITLMLLANTAFAAEFSVQVKTSEGIVQGVYDEKIQCCKMVWHTLCTAGKWRKTLGIAAESRKIYRC